RTTGSSTATCVGRGSAAATLRVRKGWASSAPPNETRPFLSCYVRCRTRTGRLPSEAVAEISTPNPLHARQANEIACKNLASGTDTVSPPTRRPEGTALRPVTAHSGLQHRSRPRGESLRLERSFLHRQPGAQGNATSETRGLVWP